MNLLNLMQKVDDELSDLIAQFLKNIDRLYPDLGEHELKDDIKEADKILTKAQLSELAGEARILLNEIEEALKRL